MKYCTSCGEAVTKARLVLNSRPICGDCAYELEYGPVERLEPPKPWRPGLYPQEEHLFPLPSAKPRGGARR